MTWNELLPLWKRGLKLLICNQLRKKLLVASIVEAWIEIRYGGLFCMIGGLLPLWKRGLKYKEDKLLNEIITVASIVEAWIEIRETHNTHLCSYGCFHCGSVD